MKKKVVAIILICVLVFSTISCGKKNTKVVQDIRPLTKEEKIEDFNYLCKVIKEGFPYLEENKRVNNVDWMANKSKYLKMVEETKDDKSYIKLLSQICSDLNNGHTNVFTDKSGYEWFKGLFNNTPYLSKAFSVLKDPLVIKRYNNLETIKRNNVASIKDSRKVILKDVIPNNVAYMYLPSFSIEKDTLSKEWVKIDNYLGGLNKYKALIIDIRGNGGGSDKYWKHIVSQLINKETSDLGYFLVRDCDLLNEYYKNRQVILKPIEQIPQKVLKNAPKEVRDSFKYFVPINIDISPNGENNFAGKIYLLVDRGVYSASESFSIFARDAGLAEIIGEKTGGDGGGMEPLIFKLPKSNILVRNPSGMYLTGNGICDDEMKTQPDYLINNVKRTENFSEDECVKKVLQLEGLDKK